MRLKMCSKPKVDDGGQQPITSVYLNGKRYNDLSLPGAPLYSYCRIWVRAGTRRWNSSSIPPQLRYHPPSSTLPALIGASAFAFNKYPINLTFSESLIVLDYGLFLLKIKILMRFGNEKLFVNVGVTVNLSPGQPKINGRRQLRSLSLLNTFD